MNRMRAVAIGTMLMFAVVVGAQQSGPEVHGGMPKVEEHLKVLAAKLDLNAEQQDKARPVLQRMRDGTEKVDDDPSLSSEERMARLRTVRSKADRELRQVLTDDQKKKLDQMEQESHLEFQASQDAGKPSQSPQN
jgi:hypothetical protein